MVHQRVCGLRWLHGREHQWGRWGGGGDDLGTKLTWDCPGKVSSCDWDGGYLGDCDDDRQSDYVQNQLDLLLLSIPIEADGELECLGCKKQQQGHVCPEDQLHWSQIFSIERMKSEAKLRDDEGTMEAANNGQVKDQGKLWENCTVADPKSHVVEEEVGVSLNNILCNINAPLKDDLSGTSENVWSGLCWFCLGLWSRRVRGDGLGTPHLTWGFPEKVRACCC